MTDNPLKQFFRRPAVYLKLPSGGAGYPPGSIDIPDNGEFPILPMTAIDEITSRTPDALFNGTAVVEIIRSCVPNILDPWCVTNVDLDPILVAIRAATHGSTMEIETSCPSCDELAKYDVNLTGIIAGFKPGEYNQPLLVDGNIQIKFKPLSFTEINKASLIQFEIQKAMQTLMAIEDEDIRNEQTGIALKDINTKYIELIAKTIEYIKVPNATVMETDFIIEYLVNCDRNSYEMIKDHSIKLRESTESKPLKVTCMHCQHPYEQPFNINISNFFA